jgi:hypothetical protein
MIRNASFESTRVMGAAPSARMAWNIGTIES